MTLNLSNGCDHNWVLAGGTNCGCFDGSCCSVPVYGCTKCGDCDYGDNEESRKQRAECKEPEWHTLAVLEELR